MKKARPGDTAEAAMPASDNDPIDTQLFWTNIVGLSIVIVLLGSFAWFYGIDFLSFLVFLMHPTSFPDH
jgi:hypothetical protein